MSRRKALLAVFGCALLFCLGRAMAAHVEVSADLAKKLLYGDHVTRMDAIKEFNKLSPDAQNKLVPDFMVAMSDEDPEVRRTAARILKAMGVKTEGQIPDAKNAVPPKSEVNAGPGQDQWNEEKKIVGGEKDKWGDLTKMRDQESGKYDDMKQQLDKEKNGPVILDAATVMKGSSDGATPMNSVVESLKDPDPWVRSQAARRLSLINPAPMDAIPLLIKMLGDKEPESRRAAAAALGSFGPLARDAVTALDAALSDPDPAVKQIAAEALKQIQQPR